MVDQIINKEDDAKMEVAGELGVSRAAISYALRMAANEWVLDSEGAPFVGPEVVGS